MRKSRFLGTLMLSGLIFAGCDMLKSKSDSSSAETEPVIEELADTTTTVQDTAAGAVTATESVAQDAEQAMASAGASLESAVEAAAATAGDFSKPTNEEIQQALKNVGLYQGSVDGVLGPRTKQAILDFQTQNNLVVDGKIGPKTWAKLGSYLSVTPAQTGPSFATTTTQEIAN